MTKLSHIDKEGKARMVDVADKANTSRIAMATGRLLMKPETLALIRSNDMPKGDVISTARIAGIMAAKKTSDLIPLCHPLLLTSVGMDFTFLDEPSDGISGIAIEATVKLNGQTGVEMEALTAVSVAGLTLYDMCKAVDKTMTLTDICVTYKTGGKSGVYKKE
jgi:cyclic pyranopterin phosphate synthase